MNNKCVGCGACEGVCKTGAVKVVEFGRRGHKPLVNKSLCNNCQVCLKACPIQEIRVPDNFLRVQRVYRAQSNSPEINLHSSSGGGVSSLLISLFNKGLIDAALVVFYDKKLNLYGDFITCADEVLKHSGSFYQSSKQLVQINKIRNYRSVAIVGLPCHIEATNRLIEIYNLKNIYLTISLFCTVGRMRNGFIDFIEQKFHKKLDSLEFFSYKSRGGKSMSRFSKNDVVLETKDGNSMIYTYTDYIGFVGYSYTPEGCFYCRKMFQLNADISIGDDWGIKSNKKVCLLSINSSRGLEAFSECDVLGYTRMHDPIKTLLESQPNGVPLKVYNCPLRIPVVRLVKTVCYLNKIPIFGKLANVFKHTAISALIKFSKRLEGRV